MLAVDTNVLVYAHRREAAVHERASSIMRELAEGSSAWAIPWPCIYEFFSVATNPRIWKDTATSPVDAWAQIEAWLASPTVQVLSETSTFRKHLGRYLAHPSVRGPIVHDARVAALCIAHGVECLITRDRDFELFPELLTRDPFRQ